MTLLEQRGVGTVRDTHRVVIETPRLILRAPRRDDAQDVAAIANDLRIAQNTSRLPHPYTVADAEQFIAHASRDDREIAFVITLANDKIIGACGIGSLNGKTPEIGYWLGVRYWGKGYATEVARAVIDHGFTELGHDVIAAGARVSNPASRRVLEKCGFQWTGVELRRVRAISSSAPVDRFRLDRGLWASLKSWGNAAPVV
jgi:RimJ/RimL family protein N-acetyltransferase